MLLSQHAGAVLRALETLPSHASIIRIAAELDMERTAVLRALARLRDVGMIEDRVAGLCDRYRALSDAPEKFEWLLLYNAIRHGYTGTLGDWCFETGYAQRSAQQWIKNMIDGGHLERVLKYTGSAIVVRTITERGRAELEAKRRPPPPPPVPAHIRDRDRLVRIGRHDRLALRRELQSRYRLPYAQVEQEMARLGFPPVEVSP